jgi:hypothetical protein
LLARVLYGLAGSQLADRRDCALTFAGQSTTVADFLRTAFAIEPGLVKWSAAVLAGHILFVRVTSIMALRYLNFLRR